VKECIKASYKAFSALCDPVYLEVLKERVNDTIKKGERVEERLRSMLSVLEVSSKAQVKGLVVTKSKRSYSPNRPWKPIGL
jgi:hypothetical protein